MSSGTHADPVRRYTPEEDERLAHQLHSVTSRVYRGELTTRRVDLALLQDFHRALFEGVRSHAGQIRRTGFGQEYLGFGPNRSVHRAHVEAGLDELLSKVRGSISSFDENPDDPAYEAGALHLAVWTHAEVIRIHPFEDGNGRTSRVLMNWVLLRLGLRPVSIEAPRQEYLVCLNRYYTQKDLEPLIDLTLRLYGEQL